MSRHTGSDRLQGGDQLVEFCRMNDALNQFHSVSRRSLRQSRRDLQKVYQPSTVSYASSG
jgi:hypothetical protein